MIVRKTALVLLLALAGAFTGACSQDNRPAAQPEAPSADPFRVPDGTPDQLMQYLAGLRTLSPPENAPAAAEQFGRKLYGAIAEATAKVLAGKPNPRQSRVAVDLRVESLTALAELRDPTAREQLLAMPGQLIQAGLPELARDVSRAILEERLASAIESGREPVERVADEVLRFIEEAPRPADLEFAMESAQALEYANQRALAAALYGRFAKAFAGLGVPQVAAAARKMEGAERRLNLIGRKLELEGQALDGQPFQWSQYQGKVVLVVFWAASSAPFRAELPNVLAAYQAFRDRGFDVLGISLDDQRPTVEQFLQQNNVPWRTLFAGTDSSGGGFNSPLAVHYGVMGVPQTILVGKDGNGGALGTRGKQLLAELEKLLGPPHSTSGSTGKLVPWVLVCTSCEEPKSCSLSRRTFPSAY